jgi:CBS domain-containing protein
MATAQRVQDVMTPNPVTVPTTATIVDAARKMREEGIGDVLVMDGDRLAGVVTDRDIVVRAIADGRSPESTKITDVCSGDVVCLTPEDSVDDAVRLMKERALRRIPILDGDRPVGVISIGDLAMERDPNSALADISAAPANT